MSSTISGQPHKAKRWIGKLKLHYRRRVEHIFHKPSKNELTQALKLYRNVVLEANFQRLFRETQLIDRNYVDHVIAQEAPEFIGLDHDEDRVMLNRIWMRHLFRLTGLDADCQLGVVPPLQSDT